MGKQHSWLTIGLAAAAFAGLGCSGETANGPDPNGVSSAIVVVSGDRQTGEVGVSLPKPIVVKVTDQNGEPMAGASVRFTVTGGGGRFEPREVTTGSDGLAQTRWVMGYVVYLDPPTAAAAVTGSDVTPARFSATTRLTQGVLSVASGDRQTGATNRLLSAQPSVRVTTPGASGVPVAGVVVLWTVTRGGGTTSQATSTDAGGVASAYWTLGNTAGNESQALRATVASLPGASADFVATAVLPPATLSIIAGDSQEGMVAHQLAQPFVIVVRNALGDPVPGVEVNWAALDLCDGWCGSFGAGGFVPGTSTTDTNGKASATLVLPAVAGTRQRVAGAWVEGAGSIFFVADVLAGPPALVVIGSGDMQSASAGSRLSQPIVVRVIDEFENGVAGVSVQWAVAPGSGSTAVASSVTDSNGFASTRWTIGTTIGTDNQTATATVAGIPGSPVTFLASALAGP